MSTDTVERDARIFRFGDYPDKEWSITADEFRAANAGETTIPVGLDPIGKGHYEGEESWLDGETGTADFEVKGDELHAKLKLPAWVNGVIERHQAKISAVFDRASKRLKKIDLVKVARVKDAVAFAGEADVVLFEDDEPDVEFCDDGKLDMAQQQHEIAAAVMPRLCSNRRPKVQFAGELRGERAARLLHDHAVHEGGAHCPGMGHHHGEEVGMSDENEDVLDEQEDGQDEEKDADKDVEFTTQTATEKALLARIERLEAEGALKDAVTFADSITRGREARAYPVERAAIVEGYQRARAVDARLGDTVTFSEAGSKRQGSHLEAFKASYAVRPRITVRDPKVVTFELDPEPPSSAQDEAKAREERRKRNLAWKAQQGASIG